MANIYYSNSLNRHGSLRAVLSSEEGRRLLEEHSTHYVGQQFPASPSPGVDFGVLRVFEGEMDEEWRAGFYLFEDNILRIEEAVHSCNASLSLGRVK
jgi:hypothetical protein